MDTGMVFSVSLKSPHQTSRTVIYQLESSNSFCGSPKSHIDHYCQRGEMFWHLLLVMSAEFIPNGE